MDLTEILRVCREWHKLPLIQFWGWSERNPGFWIILKFSLPCVEGGIKEPLAKRIWWRHLANSFALAEIPEGSDCCDCCKQPRITQTSANVWTRYYSVLWSLLFQSLIKQTIMQVGGRTFGSCIMKYSAQQFIIVQLPAMARDTDRFSAENRWRRPNPIKFRPYAYAKVPTKIRI